MQVDVGHDGGSGFVELVDGNVGMKTCVNVELVDVEIVELGEEFLQVPLPALACLMQYLHQERTNNLSILK